MGNTRMEDTSARDCELVTRTLAGESSAFRELVELHQAVVLRIAFRLSNDFHGAEDIAQEAFVRAHAKLRQFSPERGAFAPWLYQITKHVALNARRKSFPVPFPVLPDSPDDSRSPAESSMQEDDMRILDEALAKLKEPFRTAFLLAEIEELPLAMIAEMEGVPTGTIKSRKNRARAMLREALQNLAPEQL